MAADPRPKTARGASAGPDRLSGGDALLRAVVDAALDGIIAIDRNGLILSVNKAAERIFGYAAPELAGRNVKVLMPEPFAGEHDGYLTNYHATGRKKIIGIGREVAGRRKDGSVFPMDLAVREARTDGETIFVGIIRDISERKAADLALRERESRLRSILDTLPDAIVVINESGAIQSFSPAAERLFDYTEAEIVGRNVSMLMPSPYREGHDGYLQRYRTTGERRIIGIGRVVVGLRRRDLSDGARARRIQCRRHPVFHRIRARPDRTAGGETAHRGSPSRTAARLAPQRHGPDGFGHGA